MTAQISRDNRHLAMLRAVSPSRRGREPLSLRPFREEDRWELVRLAAVLNDRAETALQHPAGRLGEELLDALTRVPLEDKLQVLVDGEDRLRGFGGLCQAARLPADTGLMLGPAVEPSCQRSGSGRLLLQATEERARADGLGRIEAELGLRNIAGADFLEHCGWIRGERRYVLHARRSTRLHYFKSPRDRIQILEPGDSIEPFAGLLSTLPSGGRPWERLISDAQADLQCHVFVAERDGRPGGLLILDQARPRLAVIRAVGVEPGPDAGALFRLLHVAACQAALRRVGSIALETILDEVAAERMIEDLSVIGFRLTETCRVFRRELCPDAHG